MKICILSSEIEQSEDDSSVLQDYNKALGETKKLLTNNGHDVWIDSELEVWGSRYSEPAIVLKEILKKTTEVDMVICVINENFSDLLLLQSGYALAKQKTLIVAMPHSITNGWVLEGLIGFKTVKGISYDNFESLPQHINSLIEHLQNPD